MESFSGFKRIAVVVCPKPEELEKRTKEKKEKKGFEVPEFALNDMKGKGVPILWMSTYARNLDKILSLQPALAV